MNQLPPAETAVPLLFGLPILPVDFARAVEILSQAAVIRDERARVVVTPNVDHVVRLDRDVALKQRYARADFVFADGMPIVWASRLLGRSLPERVTGADLFVAMCQLAAREKWDVALVGGEPGSESRLRTRFQSAYPGLSIDIISPSMAFDPEGVEGDRVAALLRDRAPRVIFVCLGMPKQELWAMRHADSFQGGVLMCVGAAMEFALGLRSRAPRWVQRAGVEWLWRLLSDPRRLWRRYLIEDPYFLKICWREWRQSRTRHEGNA